MPLLGEGGREKGEGMRYTWCLFWFLLSFLPSTRSNEEEDKKRRKGAYKMWNLHLHRCCSLFCEIELHKLKHSFQCFKTVE